MEITTNFNTFNKFSERVNGYATTTTTISLNKTNRS